ncbi:MAG: response regulator [Candidatus Eisenbacteria bacterium]|nr:response regulator [Candidatus Eisenbacteria bacterium]
MSTFEQAPWTRPDSQASPVPAAARDSDARLGEAASLLLSQGRSGGDSRRIAIGLFALAAVTVALLNVGIYQSERGALVTRRWDQLDRSTETRRNELRVMFGQLHRQTAYAAAHPALAAWVSQASAGTLTPAGRRELELELDRTVQALQLHALVVIGPDGRRVAGSRGTPDVAPDAQRTLARQAVQGGQSIGGIRTDADGGQVIEIAAVIPAAARDGLAPVLIAETTTNGTLQPLLTDWSGTGPAFIVRRDGADVAFLTPPHLTRMAGARTPLTSRSARAAAMAATGVESRVEVTDAHGRVVWAVTRFLPELGWGLVGEASRDAMLAEMRTVLIKVLMLDLVIALLIGAGVWLWRRQYATGLARHEIKLTNRHAARVQAVLDTAFDAIITFDRAGRVRTVNRAAEQMFGRAAAEMDGQPLHRFLHWGATGPRAGQHALPTPGVVCVAEAKRGDGQVFPAEFSLGQAGEGEDLLYTAIVRDISERVEAEKRIRTFAEGLEGSNRRLEEVNAQLQEASRLKSEFLANTSHELRTPLNGMIGFLQLVLDGLCENREEERDFLKQGLQCSRHLLGLINDVLDIAKIEAGKLNVETEKVDVMDLFAEVETVTHVQAQQARIALVFEPPPETGVFARCDFGKTKQVLINLIGNGLKFTPKGSITVRATAHADLGHVMFEVIDTGIGIPRDRQKMIFEKFTQGDGSTTRKYGGTGLGLAISRSLVELMGGIIGVHSDGEGKGTRMYFSLPVWDEAAAAAPPIDESAGEQIEGPGHGPLVLVVEDDPVFRHFLTALLHAHGYRTVQAAHAEGAWVLIRRLQPAVVVLDYALSCREGATLRTGWDLAERMIADHDTRHVPLIFVTGFDAELREKLRSTAFSRKPEHLMKPVDGSVLIAKIEEMVGGIQGRHVRVLMADDDPTVAAFVRKVLPDERYHIEMATNGEECLHILRTQPRGFDLLLLDLMMPEVSGYEVLREMAVAGTAADLPVVVLTNYPEARNPEEKRLLDQGLVLDVLPKTSVHDSPQLLSHIIDWHMQVADEAEAERAA